MSKSILLAPGFTGFASAEIGSGKPLSDKLAREQIEEARREVTAECNRRLEEERAQHQKRLGEFWRSFEANFLKFQAGIEQTINDQLIETAARIAEVILQSRLPDRDMIVSVVRQTIEPLTDLQGVRLRLSPADARDIAAVREAGPKSAIPDPVEIVEDTSLNTGDVVIESRNGYFNAKISERLEILKQKLKELSRDAHSDNA
jgi:flagellar biosynthesis/type III secretory pathway protein FliH